MNNLDEQVQLAAALIASAKYGVAFTGAGISTPSGIPDFRSPDSGLWANVDPLEVASIYGFRQNPAAFYRWVQPLALTTLNAQPNPAHYALAQLERFGLLQAVITQNIDMLHTRAGSKTVYELHGHMRHGTCIHCFTSYDGEALIRDVLATGDVPQCTKCGGVIKPDVILFGEQLPVREFLAAKEASRKADVMIIIGSSLEVAPASDLPTLAVRNGAKLIIINLQSTPMDSSADVVIHANVAEVLPSIIGSMEARR